MATADLTALDIRVNGVNADSTPVRTDAYLIDVADNGVTEVGTHKIANLPKGVAVVAARLTAIVAVAGGTGATVKVGVTDGTQTADVGSATAITSLDKNAVVTLSANGKTYFPETEPKVTITVATAALTGGKLLLEVDTVPVAAMLTKG